MPYILKCRKYGSPWSVVVTESEQKDKLQELADFLKKFNNDVIIENVGRKSTTELETSNGAKEAELQ